MFVVVQGGIRGFTFTGPFETKILAEQWLIHQASMLGEIIKLVSVDVDPGKFVLVTGNPFDGFEVTGTFFDYDTVFNWSALNDPWIITLCHGALQCP